MKIWAFQSKWFTQALLVSMLLVSACAHQEGGMTDEEFLEGDTAYEAMTDDSYASSDDGLAEFEATGEAMADSGEFQVSADLSSLTEGAASEQEGLGFVEASEEDALGLPSDSALEMNSEVAGNELAALEPMAMDEGAFPMESNPVEGISNEGFVEDSSMPELVSQTEPTLEQSPEASPELSFEQSPELSFESAAMPTLEQPATQPEVASPAPRRVAKAKTPKVPSQPVEQNGELLNRFYVLRNSDTPEDLSELFYGSPERAEDIQAWNKGKSWKSGQMVFYISPLQPADGEMRSFYQERGIVAQEYVAQKGDTLGSIASREYGNAGSWKEVAISNQMDSPDNLKVGDRLVLFPKDLSAYSLESNKPQVAKASNNAPQQENLDGQINNLEKEISSLENELNQELAAAPSLERNPAAEAPLMAPMDAGKLASPKAEMKEPKLASPDVSSFIQRNLTLFLVLTGLLIGALFWVVFKKPSDSNDF